MARTAFAGSRAAGVRGLGWLATACTQYLTHMHTGDRSAGAIDAGDVLPGYQGIIVRDGYSGYGHLTDALHAWCGAHLLRDLKDLHDFEPGEQDWAQKVPPCRHGQTPRAVKPTNRNFHSF